ncbi:5-methyltetrahydropteroyltriglutamate--homocysteine S-methyltransferase [Clostridium butyricum]|uniref:5-methyltetrahydropteroyltriglutamate--homocysteine methyltransferase n=2 Tax=Clostridium butyricum TaxID=1492 RepID=A0AAP9RJ11_CLOBU|nr:5-methyltetrahydropteroyltriglutamate--homocysteine S-methyltransferase [Clostridium butyricum]MBZ5748375.1 5-methyltetrahydropteroyltriglutamate--homocysteine S-methyltransferase [Clostridium butyricum]QMW93375.1 5-methyltetrahydropteroyltriglutamate--homocysteine S-methyltransferase [Clostridium butyricum]BBK78830.1 5-methyltetrahydropteroyltriglutamate--homocysteine S-methyltransferase [Clostridium butyricum]GEQ25046.1 5-methyltetrahydropteroyltriglutamate--homocysteine S-methyltransferas
MKNSIIGYPRVGKSRELKFWTESYFRKEISSHELLKNSKELREEQWQLQKDLKINYIPSNDFSFYDIMLDTVVLLNAIPNEYKELKVNVLDTYFAMARGYQGENGDVKALSMKKWFNTNYHYIVPELYDYTKIKLNGEKPFLEYLEAKEIGIKTKPVIMGGFTFLKLAKYQGKKKINDYVDDIVDSYVDILNKFNEIGVELVQIDEPILVTDLTKGDIRLFISIYKRILKNKGNVKILLQTYFGDIRDCYKEIMELDFDAVGLDFIEGKQSMDLISRYGFPKEKVLFAGIVNGKNIWRCNYKKDLELLHSIEEIVDKVVINTSCSLLHVPYTLENETKLSNDIIKHFSFAKEKLNELNDLSSLASYNNIEKNKIYIENQKIFLQEKMYCDKEVQERVNNLKKDDFIRKTARKERQSIQKEKFKLPILPTTTIGSFPQTLEVKQNRSKYRKGEITKNEYDENIKRFIKECIKLQEELNIDVLVHGEYERNDMVEFFGENLSGYVFTEKAWVQSYGTRCVKPPIIFGDIKREKAITVSYSKYAQSLTEKPVKGMLTGPVTILNWSFPRQDIELSEMAFQIGLAIRDEVMDLESKGIGIIQIDEAALKEKLPIRREEWNTEYLDWAIKAFRLCQSKVKPETQIHTHMCYSEFEEIVKEIDSMDADVISFEASRSKLTIIAALNESNFETEVGPGIYDIHSPRVPSVEELVAIIKKMLLKISKDKLWINPDCGLKTRGVLETKASLKNLVQATNIVRNYLD